jgi:hypothetical protein
MCKLQIPAASYLMELAAIDWFKDTKRMDNVARQKGCVAQVTQNTVTVVLSCCYLFIKRKILTSFSVSHIYYFYLLLL